MWKNNDQAYGWITVILHWLMAIVLVFMFGLGLYMVDLSYYDPWYRDALSLHKSIGVMLFIVLLLRIIWRWSNKHPLPIVSPRWQMLAAKATHYALYCLMFFIMISGYLISTADGRALEVFSLFSIPSIPVTFANQEDIAGEIHEYLAWTFIVLVALHSLAAIKHHFIEKDDTLRRMLNIKR